MIWDNNDTHIPDRREITVAIYSHPATGFGTIVCGLFYPDWWVKLAAKGKELEAFMSTSGKTASVDKNGNPL